MSDAVPTTPRRVGKPAPHSAAFFDVDGTLVNSTIVHYYMYFKRQGMPPFVSAVWRAGFLLKCGYYLLLDRISRSRLNIVFYRIFDRHGWERRGRRCL